MLDGSKAGGLVSRRAFLAVLAMAGAAAPRLGQAAVAQGKPKATPFPLCIFSKHLQWLGYDGMADLAAEAGFDGVDLAVRPGGHVLPENVETDLPRAVEAVRRAGLAVPMMATGINDPDDPRTVPVLEAASGLGIQFYRMAYLRYDEAQGVAGSLEAFRPRLARLASLNARYRIHGAYQNHAGNNYVGAPVWDLWPLLEGLDPEWIGCQYDIRHATVEGGTAWPLGLKLLAPYVRCLVLKDFIWAKEEGRWRVRNMPLGEGMVDFEAYFEQVRALGIRGPVSLHLEYPLPGEHESLSDAERRRQLLPILRKDLDSARAMLRRAGLA